MAKIKIYNSILFGNLRPWQKENTNQDSFLHKLSPGFRCESCAFAEYDNALSKAIKHIPELLLDDEGATLSSVVITFHEPLISYETPLFYNPKTEFYYYLIRNEGIRFINKLYSEVQSSETNSLAIETIDESLNHIKYLLTEATALIKQVGYDENLPFTLGENTASFAIKKDSDYILRLLQWSLIPMILEIQELFPVQLTSQPLSEDDIYIKFIGTHSPIRKFAKKITKLNEFLTQRFLTNYEFTLKMAIERLEFTKREFLLYKDTPSSFAEQTNRNEGLFNHILIIENLIFIRCFTNAVENPTYEDLLSPGLSESAFQDYKARLNKQFEQFSSANKRLEVIENEILRYDFLKSNYIIEESLFKLSIPRRILNWIQIQKRFYESNLNIDLSKLPKAELPKIPTDLTVAELSFLFKALYDAKLIKPLHDEDMYKVIAAFFSSLKKEDISFKSIKNKFLSPEAKAVDFWETGFSKLQKIATKIRQELSE